ncbi:hypothetical protein [Paenibacillus harenae]|uniref:hypothetical protein n=1 Tax=Paenibacillus harenae TaxID=306543 RepID=UPI000406D4BC|nr:hypothetical protein [Paenibacillus harenae]
MYICFAEYRISPEQREQYLLYTEALLAESRHVYIYEGTDQPNLFVEVWHAPTAAAADDIKKERCNERSPWFRISEWVIGGAAKLHVWTFKPVLPKEDCWPDPGRV